MVGFDAVCKGGVVIIGSTSRPITLRSFTEVTHGEGRIPGCHSAEDLVNFTALGLIIIWFSTIDMVTIDSNFR